MAEVRNSVVELPLTDIFADHDWNCRDGDINPSTVVELGNSIKKQGLIQPVLVMPYNRPGYPPYKLVVGFRRYVAHEVHKLPTILAIVRENLSEADAKIINLTENLDRCELNILQEAKAVAALLNLGLNEQTIAKRLNKYPTWVSQRIKLMGLPVELQNEIKLGVLKASDINDLYAIYQTTGKTNLFNIARQIKEARLTGRNEKVKMLLRKNHSHKRARTKGEIEVMMNHLINTVGSGLHTRLLAWAIGNISDSEVRADIFKYAADNDVDYTDIARDTEI